MRKTFEKRVCPLFGINLTWLVSEWGMEFHLLIDINLISTAHKI